jgi:hypothetical protein
MNDFVLCILDITTQQILEDADVKGFPMFVQDMRSCSFVKHKKPRKIYQSNLGLFFSGSNHFNQLSDGCLRDVVKREATFEPGFEVSYFTNFLRHCLRVNEFGDELFHFIHVCLCVKPDWSQMIWSEHFKLELFVRVSSNHLTLRYQTRECGNDLFKLWLVGTFEVLKNSTVMESDEVWDACNLEVSWSVSDNGRAHGSKDEIWVLVGFGEALEGWLDSHTWRACGAPEIDD